MSTICPLLWNHSFISTTSQNKPCCRVQQENYTDDWDKSIFLQGVESPAHIKARQEMRNGDWPQVCTVCKTSESRFGYSYRTMALEKTGNSIDYTKEPNNQDITSIDVKFNNICNLECVMCNTASSSMINEFVKQHKNSAPKSMGGCRTIDWKEEEKLEWCKKIIAYGKLKTLKTTGGEPFAQKHFWQLIDWCIENNLTYFEIKITTNGTKFNKLFLEKLAKFRLVQITISCDGTGDVYEYIRFRSKWAHFENNLKLLKQFVDLYPNKFAKVSVACVLQAYNFHNILDLYNFSNLYKIGFHIDCFIHPRDTVFSLRAIPEKIRKKLVKKIKNTKDPELKKYVYMMQNTKHDKFKTEELYKQTIKFDRVRKTDFRTLDLPFELSLPK